MGGGGVWLLRRRALLLLGVVGLRAERLALAAMAADRRRVVTGIADLYRAVEKLVDAE